MKGRARLLGSDRVERDLGYFRLCRGLYITPPQNTHITSLERRMPQDDGDPGCCAACSTPQERPSLPPTATRSTSPSARDAKIADLKLPQHSPSNAPSTGSPHCTSSHASPLRDDAHDNDASGSLAGHTAYSDKKRNGKSSGGRSNTRAWRRTVAVVMAAAIASALAMVAYHGDTKALDMNDIVAEAIAAHDEAEELAARGDTWRAVSALEQVSARLTKIERAARYVSADKGDEVQLYEEAQLAWGHARATMGSLLFEQATATNTPIEAKARHWLAGRAVQALQPTCPTLWYLSRRTNPGDDHVRGEIGWARCYADLIAAHRFRGEDRLAAAIERDVVKHSTPWFRRRRDSKHLLPANHSKSERRQHELHLRWPLEPNKLRFSKSFSRPPRSVSRAQRNARRARAIFALSRLAALSPAERAITARDFGRAKTKARALRRDLDDLMAKFFEAYADTLQRARILGKLRDVATGAVRHLDDEEQQHQHHNELYTETSSSTTQSSDADDQMARWNAGVALAAMLRASQQAGTNNETNAEPTPTWASSDTQGALEDALDALVSSDHHSAENEPAIAAGATVSASKRFGRAFARHVANEAADYVAVAVGAHHHGWAWLHAELSRLDEVQRRLALAITPLAGPPPGFVGRYELLHAWIARRDRSFYESRPSNIAAEQQSARQQASDKPRHAKQSAHSHEARRAVEDELTTVRSASLAAFCAVALSAAHGTALLREQQRKENDGYTKRRPKRTLAESFRALLAHFCLALCVCALSCWTRLKNALVPMNDDLMQLIAVFRGVLDPRSGRTNSATARRPTTDDTSPSQRSPPATAVAAKKEGSARPAARARLTTRNHETSRVTPRVSPRREDESGKQLEDVTTNKSKALSSIEDDNTPSNGTEWREQDADDDDWKPVPKGGRIVHEGPRILATSTKAEIGVRDQAAVALNVGVSAVPVAKSAPSPRQQLSTPRSVDDCDKIAKMSAKQPLHPSAASKAARAEPHSQKVAESAPKITNHRRQAQPQHAAANGHSHKGQSSKAGEWKRKVRSSAKQHVAGPGNSWMAYASSLPVVDTTGYAVSQRAPSPVSVSSDLGGKSLEDAIRHQVEYYFSVSNLCKDVYLRTHCMDSKGYVTLAHICSFKRVRALTDDAAVVRDALLASTKLELVDAAQPQLCKVRTVDQPERWTTRMPPSKQSAAAGDSSSSDNSEDDDDGSLSARACNAQQK